MRPSWAREIDEIDVVQVLVDLDLPQSIDTLDAIQLDFRGSVDVAFVVFVATIILDVMLHSHPEPVPQGVQALLGNGALTIFALLLLQSNFRSFARLSTIDVQYNGRTMRDTHLQ